jgi:hypothetical protein
MARRESSQRQWRRMICRRCIAAAVDQAFEAEKRIPGMRRDHDKPPIVGQHTARLGEPRRLIRKMFEHTDEQNELESIEAMHAKIRCIVFSKLQAHARGVPPGARDHGGADIDTDSTGDDIGKVKQDLPGAAAEIEHARAMEVTANSAEVLDARGKFRRACRYGALLRIPSVSDKIELPPRVR